MRGEPGVSKQKQVPGTAFWVLGCKFFIRTVTHHLTGELVGIDDHEILLKDAAWIPDDGRFMSAVKDCVFNEVEPYPNGKIVAVGRNSLIDAVQISKLPREQK